MRDAGYISIEQEGRNSWRLFISEKEGGRLLYEARGLKSLDEALDDLSRWRSGVVIV